MSDKFKICFATAAGFLVATDLIWCFGLAVVENAWTALGIGAGLLIAAGILALISHATQKSWKTALMILLAAAGCGFGLTACIRGLGYEVAVSGRLGLQLLACLGISLAVFLGYGLIADAMERGLKLFTFLGVGLTWLIGVILWVAGGTVFFCLLFFHLFLALLYCFPLIICAENPRTLRKNLILSSLTVAFLVLLIALLILTEGEGLDGGDLIDGFSVESPKKSKINRPKSGSGL